MNFNENCCFTCLKNDRKKLFNINALDIDKISYLDKLKYCFSLEYVDNISIEICWFCVQQLRATYKFKETVLASQKYFKTYLIEKRQLETNTQNIKIELIQPNSSYDNEEEKIKNESDNEKEHECDDDNNVEKEKLKNKIIIENEKIQKYECANCFTIFNKKWKLQKHIKRVHDLNKNFICTYCNKEFKQSSHLKEHITSHTGEKNFCCHICGKKFQRSSSQRRHMRSHDAAPGQKTKRTPCLCSICGKNFPFSNGLQRHMRIHWGIKNYQCNYCNRKFTQSTHLHVHMRTHTGEKPYICDICGHKYSLKSCLVKHVNNHQ